MTVPGKEHQPIMDPSNRLPRPCALTIAGSDSGGGAGIQADLKTFAAHGVHGLSAISALTAQHTRGVAAIHLPPPEFLRAQIASCFDDFSVAAVKLGMLANAEIIHLVADALEYYQPAHIVLDPVMVATSGAKLLEDSALTALRERLLPLASIITPNMPEAELLLGHAIGTGMDAEAALAELHNLGTRAVLLKGGHLDEGAQVIDRLDDGHTTTRFLHARLTLDSHGTGCTLAAALAACLARGASLIDACRNATEYVAHALNGGYQPGRGAVVILNHIGALRPF